MPAWFYNLHVVTALLMIYAVFGVVGFIGYKLNSKFFRQDSSSSIISLAQQTSITFGTIFIAFWIALNWQSLSSLSLASKSEAQAILDLYSNSHSIDDVAQAKNVRLAINDYIGSIVNEEYKSLEQGKLNPHTALLFNLLKLRITLYQQITSKKKLPITN